MIGDTLLEVKVTPADISSPNRGNWWDDPIRRAIMRIEKISYPDNVIVGWGYCNITIDDVIYYYDFNERNEQSQFMKDWKNENPRLDPATFTMRLTKIREPKPPSQRAVNRRFVNSPPRRIAKSGM